MSDPQKLVFASVLLDSAIDQFLDYQIPEQFLKQALPGTRVKVPVKSTLRPGTIVSLKQTPDVPKVHAIAELLSDKPLISPDLFQLAHWIAAYYCCPVRKVIKSIMPPSVRGTMKHKEQLFIQPSVSLKELASLCEPMRLTHPLQAQVLDVLLKHPKGILLSKLLEHTQKRRSPIDTLIKKKLLSCQKVQVDRSPLEHLDYFPTKPKTLNAEQQEAIDQIKSSLTQGIFETRLIFGVTGSGKTEIYLQAIQHALSLGKGVIFLVPEIALTSQTVERLRSRFCEKIALLHHRLSEGERHDTWHQIQSGVAPIVIGARSAILSPVPNLGLIIVDEEQESSFKQTDEAPCYHARDVAIMRGKYCKATVLLGSATPSFESYTNALKGKYALSVLRARADQAHLPTIHIIDMNREFERAKSFTLFSETLLNGIKQRVTSGEQTILFLNRRGYHTSQMCQSCSHVIECPHCSVSLTFHLNDNVLSCHLCDYRLSPPPRSCPKCKAEATLKFKGAGTEMVERALHAIFPEVRTLRLDADTTRHKGSHEMLFKQFKAGKADVLIGTQMIAKGLHFPSVTLVGVLNTDGHLQIPDFRASEHVFQLITQVSGRSGRGFMKGEVIIQTRMPEHPVITLAAAQEYEAFYTQEIAVREMFGYPPFGHLVKVAFSGKNEQGTLSYAKQFRAELIARLPPSYEMLPAVTSGHAKIKGQFRFQFLIKGEKMGQLVAALEQLRKQHAQKLHVRIHIDVDPLSTFF